MNKRHKFPVRTFLLLLLIMLAVVIPFLLFGAQVDAWTDTLILKADSHRLTVALVLVLLLASDMVMPVPSSLISTACGLLLGFAGGTLASWAGMTMTSVSGYLMGRYAARPAERMIGGAEGVMLRDFHRRHGLWLLLAMRPVPVLAEASVLFSGISRLPPWPVFVVTASGNLAVSMVYAGVGAWGRAADAFLPAFGASIMLSGVLMLWMRVRHRGGRHGQSEAGGEPHGE